MQVLRAFGANKERPFISFITQSKVIYTSDNIIVLHDLISSRQEFIYPSRECKTVTSAALDPERKEIAVAEQRRNDEPIVYRYLIESKQRRKKKLHISSESISGSCSKLNTQNNDEISCLNFSKDGQHILGIAVTEDPSLIIWSRSSSTIVAQTKIFYGLVNQLNHTKNPYQSYSTATAICASFSSLIYPKVENEATKHSEIRKRSHQYILISGTDLLKLYKFTEKRLKPITIFNRKHSITKELSVIYTSHSWLSLNTFVVSTVNGDVLLFRNNEFVTTISDCGKGKIAKLLPIITEDRATWEEVFGGLIVLSKEAAKLEVANENIGISEPASELKFTKAITKDKEPIIDGAVSPENDKLVYLTLDNALLFVPISNIDILETEQSKVHTITRLQKSATVDVCSYYSVFRRCLLTFVGGDKFQVHDVNPIDFKHQLSKEYQLTERILAISLHPFGYEVVVCFQQSIKIFELLVSGLHEIESFPIKLCKIAVHSVQGQYFAVYDYQLRLLKVFSTYKFDLIASFKGHVLAPNCIEFCCQDTILLTSGIDGKIFINSLQTGLILKKFSFIDGLHPIKVRYCFEYLQNESLLALHTSANTLFESFRLSTLTETGKLLNLLPLKNLVNSESLNLYELDKSVLLDFEVIVDSNTNDGCVCILSYKATPLRPPSIMILKVKIIDMEISMKKINSTTTVLKIIQQGYKNLMLCTRAKPIVGLVCKSESGTVFVCELPDISNTKPNKGNVIRSLATLVGRDQISSKRLELEKLKTELSQQERSVETETNRIVNETKVKISTEEEEHKYRMEGLNNLLKTKKNEVQEIKSTHDQTIKTTIEEQSKDIQSLKSSLEENIASQKTKIIQLEEEIKDLNSTWSIWQIRQQKQVNEIVAKTEESASKQINHLESEINHTKERIEKLKKQLNQRISEQSVKNDEQYFTSLAGFHTELSQNKSKTAALRVENESLKKVLTRISLEDENQKQRLLAEQETKRILVEQIESLEKEKNTISKEIDEREETINDKEKQVFEIKKKNQELEKFKFVLEYKIKELAKQMEPQKKEKESLVFQLRAMEKELRCYHRNNFDLDMMVTELNLKLKGMKKALSSKTERIVLLQQQYFKQTSELEKISDLVGDKIKAKMPILKAQLIDLGRNFLCSSQNIAERENIKENGHLKNDEIVDPWIRMRAYLESSLVALKRKHKQDINRCKRDMVKLDKEYEYLEKEYNSITSNNIMSV